jgi:sulfotransferase
VQAKHLLVVGNEQLAKAPEKVMELVCNFIGEPQFAHDFAQVEYDAPDFDLELGIPSLHRVKPKVVFTERRTINPSDLFDKFFKISF